MKSTNIYNTKLTQAYSALSVRLYYISICVIENELYILQFSVFFSLNKAYLITCYIFAMIANCASFSLHEKQQTQFLNGHGWIISNFFFIAYNIYLNEFVHSKVTIIPLYTNTQYANGFQSRQYVP